jgi:predicted phosphodiesterase
MSTMERPLRYVRFNIFIAITLVMLSGILYGREEFLSELSARGSRYLKIWVHSDIQPRNLSERSHYETSIQDIRSNIKDVYIAIVAGDIVQRRTRFQTYEWFLKLRSQTAIKYWYEIAGNHEAKNLSNYHRYLGKPLYYSVRVGNIVFLFLSDEIDSPPTEISERAFRWWRERVIENQHNIIITVTHGLLQQSNLLGTTLSKMIIKDSERFAEILKKYRVDIWISGHTHLPHYLPGKSRVANELNGTLFIDVSAIRKDLFADIESSIFTFRVNSIYVLIQSRNHEKHQYNNGLDVLHQLHHPFIWDGSPPKISYP